MSPASSERTAAAHRSRRWDAIILGSALPGLVTACRLAMAGQRVLLVEEEQTSQAFQGLWEPFLLPGIDDKSIIQACLTDCRFPLIDRRKLIPDDVALQLITPKARVNIGGVQATDKEFQTWGLSGGKGCRSLLNALAAAARAEREWMLNAPFARTSRFRGTGRSRPTSRPGAAIFERGLPAEYGEAPAELRSLLEAQAQAISNAGKNTLPPEARAYLLGAPLEGGCSFSQPGETLRGLFRQRLTVLNGDFRKLRKGFDFTEVNRLPGIAPRGSNENWVGRCLIFNTPLALVAEALKAQGGPLPSILGNAVPYQRRARLHWRLPKACLPEAMARHLVCTFPSASQAAGAENADGNPIQDAFRLQVFPSSTGTRFVELLASATVPPEQHAEALAQMEQVVCELLPFSQDKMEPLSLFEPQWDDPSALADSARNPAKGAGWPAEIQLRLSQRPPVYDLPRHNVGSLGVEGDLLLGWRAGDSIRSELE
ncbi:MAG: hypothetical protein JRC77_07995 [Deltaproteobacteria bacterium]|nr:hypothetical protein [Deltaproteobacteria bacterium]